MFLFNYLLLTSFIILYTQ